MSRKAEQYGGVGDRGLGMELRFYREKANLSLERVGALLGWSANTMSRLERGLRQDTTTDEVSAILAAIEVTGKDRARLMRMAKRRSEQGWWEGADAKLSDQVRTYRTFEQRATRIVNVESLLVPGLLQTPEYMHALLLGLGEDKSDITGRIARRVIRQELLDRKWNAPEAVFVICERALRLPVGGPALMARQVRHIAAQAERPHVSVRIVPDTVVVHPALRGPFVVLEFADEPPVVFIEARMSGLFPETPTEIEAYMLDAERLMDLALSEQESLDLLRAIAEDLERAR